MRKTLGIFILLVLVLVSSVLAYDVGVSSADSSKAEIYFTGLSSVDVVFDNIQVVVETESLTDRYIADYSLEVRGEIIYLSTDLSEIFEDYSIGEVKSIVVSGEIDGEDFAKRVAIREGENVRFGAPDQTSTKVKVVYWVLALLLIFVVAALLVLLAHDTKHMRKQKYTRKPTAKKKTKKKSSKAKKKKTSKKKAKTKKSKKKAKKT
jgi:hypothetical protein